METVKTPSGSRSFQSWPLSLKNFCVYGLPVEATRGGPQTMYPEFLTVADLLDAGMLDGVPPPQTPSVHTRPTVRRMVAIDAAAIESAKRRDPRREEE